MQFQIKKIKWGEKQVECLTCGAFFNIKYGKQNYCDLCRKTISNSHLQALSRIRKWYDIENKCNYYINKEREIFIDKNEFIKLTGLNDFPKNEQEVVFLFSRFFKELGFEKIITLQSPYPDCIALTNENKQVTIEFEYYSSNFINHIVNPKHKLCNFLICWEDGVVFTNCELSGMKMISLKNFFYQKLKK